VGSLDYFIDVQSVHYFKLLVIYNIDRQEEVIGEREEEVMGEREERKRGRSEK
jgi:hypothetical protein